MRQYCVYAKPELPSLNEIQKLRHRFDPLAENIPPHITLVFPFYTDIATDLLASHIDQYLQKLDSIPIRMRSPEARDSYAYFPVEDTTGLLFGSFEKLNGGMFAKFRSTEHPFRPHVTFGRYETENEKTLLLSAARSIDLTSGQILKICLEEILETQMGQVLHDWNLGPQCIFETENFIVRTFTDDDATDCESFLADKEVMRFIGDGKFQFERTNSLKMVQWFRQSCESQKGLGTWAIVAKNTGRVVGNCHLSNCPPEQEIEFGLALARNYWGHGYATEICRSLLKYGNEQLGPHRIVGTVHPENLASKNVLKKLGYRFDRLIYHYGINQELYQPSEPKFPV